MNEEDKTCNEFQSLEHMQEELSFFCPVWLLLDVRLTGGSNWNWSILLLASGNPSTWSLMPLWVKNGL